MAIRNRQRHNAHIACIYVAGVVSDALEANIPNLVRDFKEWKKSGQKSAVVHAVYEDSLQGCLKACQCSLVELTTPLREKFDVQGTEKLKHAQWLEYQMNGGQLTEAQKAEISRATIKYRYHKEKFEESLSKATQSADKGKVPPPTALGAEGAGSSSSGLIYNPIPQRTRPVPQRNPAPHPIVQPATPFVLPQGPIPARGQAKRVREHEHPSRTVGQAAADPFVAMVERHRTHDKVQQVEAAAPILRRNPNQDIRYPARSPPPVQAPPGQWVPDPPGQWVPDPPAPITGYGGARAAADRLPWADSRAEARVAAAAIPYEAPPVVYPTRVRLGQGEAVWSPLENDWVYPAQNWVPDWVYQVRERSRSPPPTRLRQHPYAGRQGPIPDPTTYDPVE